MILIPIWLAVFTGAITVITLGCALGYAIGLVMFKHRRKIRPVLSVKQEARLRLLVDGDPSSNLS